MQDQDFTPPQPPRSFRVVLDLYKGQKRLDSILLAELKNQKANLTLSQISRTQYKDLFKSGRIVIKGQKASPSSSLSKGITYIDILGYAADRDPKLPLLKSETTPAASVPPLAPTK